MKGVKCITPLAYMLLIPSKIRNDYEVDDDDEDGRLKLYFFPKVQLVVEPTFGWFRLVVCNEENDLFMIMTG